MNNKNKNIYGGLNPIYESILSSVREDKENGKDVKSVKVDTIGTLINIMNTFFTILMNSKMENAKTTRGFQEIKNKILECKNVGSLRQYIITSLESFKSLDKAQKEAYDINIKYVIDSFYSIESALSDLKLYDSIKKDTLIKILNNFEEDLKEREQQMRKTNPTLFNEVVKKGLVLKEDSGALEEEEFRGKAFNKSKASLDAAASFVGMISRDQYNPTLKNNADVKRYSDIAGDLSKKAQDIQMLDRRGLRNIVTPTGEIKRNDYMRQQDSLVNEIIRQKKEYNRIKDGILKNAGSANVIPPPIETVCDPGYIFDKSTSSCVPIKKASVTPAPTVTPKITKDCTFPVTLNTKCKQVGEIQSKLMIIAPSVKSYLSKKGGSDNVYGKGTATVCNIIWGYLSNNQGQLLTSDLTKEMYDGIMALTENDIDTSTVNVLGAIKDNKSEEISIDLKIQEMENIKESSVLSFEDFYSVIEESSYFSKMDEASLETIEGPTGGGVKNAPGRNFPKKIKDSCIKDSIAQGKVVPCDGTVPREEEKKKEEEKIKIPPTREEWKGFKYVETGTYPVAFDESLLSAWSKEVVLTAVSFIVPGSGYILKAGTAGAKALAARGAVALAKEAAKKAAAKTVASWQSRRAAVWFAKYKTIPITGRTSAGLIGGTVGSGVADFISGRNSFIITTVDGYIERNNLLGMVGGLVDTLDGYVSDEDIACIASVLAVIKGSWTISNDGKPISAWGEVKRIYLQDEGEDLSADIMSISSKVGDVEGFPSLKASNPLIKISDIPWGSALAEVKDFVSKLDANESTLKGNIDKLPADYVRAHEEGEYEDVTFEELESGNKEGEEEDIEQTE